MKIHSSSKNYNIIPSAIHQAALDPHISIGLLKQICDITNKYKFNSLTTSLNTLPFARKELNPSSQTKIITVIGFPFGNIPVGLKKNEAEWAIDHGTDELEIVPNFFALSQGQIEIFAEELAEICELGMPVRVILDSQRLTTEKLTLAINYSIEAGICGIQNGNGFGPKVSTMEIKRLTELINNRCSIKAVGGIKRLEHAINLLEAGATYLGTSCGLELINELIEMNNGSRE
tara:strand:+ start:117 stop:812 length:696 start_codon:yes stop_codon:yes gene_type:complete